MLDDPWDGRDWYYWDTVRKSGKLVADAAWELAHPSKNKDRSLKRKRLLSVIKRRTS